MGSLKCIRILWVDLDVNSAMDQENNILSGCCCFFSVHEGPDGDQGLFDKPDGTLGCCKASSFLVDRTCFLFMV